MNSFHEKVVGKLSQVARERQFEVDLMNSLTKLRSQVLGREEIPR